MYFGSAFLGTVKKFNKQSIQTKFLLVAIPLAPTSDTSLLVTEHVFMGRKGFPVKLHKQSVIAGYTRVLTLVGSFVSILLALNGVSDIFIYLAFIFTPLAIYLTLFYGKSTPAENRERQLIGDLTGAYGMVDWFLPEQCYTFYNALRANYEVLHEGTDWKTALKNGKISTASVPLVYGMALFYAAYDPYEESILLREKAAELYSQSVTA